MIEVVYPTVSPDLERKDRRISSRKPSSLTRFSYVTSRCGYVRCQHRNDRHMISLDSPYHQRNLRTRHKRWHARISHHCGDDGSSSRTTKRGHCGRP